MPSKKTTPAAADQAATSATADTTPAPAAPMPACGGCWIRQPDGTLVPDPAEHPDGAGDTPPA